MRYCFEGVNFNKIIKIMDPHCEICCTKQLEREIERLKCEIERLKRENMYLRDRLSKVQDYIGIENPNYGVPAWLGTIIPTKYPTKKRRDCGAKE